MPNKPALPSIEEITKYPHIVIDDTDHFQPAIPEAMIALLPQLKQAGYTHCFIEWDRHSQQKAENKETRFGALPYGLARVFTKCQELGMEPVLMDVPLKDPRAIAFWRGEHYNGTASFPPDAPPEYRRQHEPGRQIFLRERMAANAPMTDLIAAHKPVKSISMIGSAHTAQPHDFEDMLAEKLGAPVIRLSAKPMPSGDAIALMPNHDSSYGPSQDKAEFNLVIGIESQTTHEAKRSTEFALYEILRMSRSGKLRGPGFPEAAHLLRDARVFMEKNDYSAATASLTQAQDILKNPRGGPYGQSLAHMVDSAQKYAEILHFGDIPHYDEYSLQFAQNQATRDLNLVANAVLKNVPPDQQCLLPIAAKGLTALGEYVRICDAQGEVAPRPTPSVQTPAAPTTTPKR